MNEAEALSLTNSILEWIDRIPRNDETYFSLVAHLMEDGFGYPEKSLAHLQERVTDELAVVHSY